MPKMNCTCGVTLSYGEIPCPIEWVFISDTDFDDFSGMVDSEEVYNAMSSFLRCPTCNRVWIFWNGFGEPPEEFVPQTELLRQFELQSHLQPTPAITTEQTAGTD